MKTHGEIAERTRWKCVQFHVPHVFGEIMPGIQWIGEWVVYSAGLVAVVKRKVSTLPGIKPQSSRL
jgi:hypothetical protein